MNTKQPVFFLSNTDRKDEFLIETRIWNNDSSFVIEKKAVNEKSQKHLDNMVNTYHKLSDLKKLSSLINILAPAQSSDQKLIFDYIEGPTAERVLLEKILIEDKQGVCDIIEKLFTLINCLPSIKTNPASSSKYVAVFGKSFNKTLDCTKLGVIDLNLDNIIIDEHGKWHFYDYEWVFEFAIPKQLLRTRFLWYFLYRHREILRYHAQRLESVHITKDIFMPKFLYERYNKIFEELKDMLVAASCFQFYVTGKEDRKLSNINSIDVEAEKIKVLTVGIEAAIKKMAAKETEKTSRELQSEHKHRAEIEKRLNAKTNQLNEITSSKTYRTALKLASIKRKILPK